MNLLSLRKEDSVMFIQMQKNPVVRYLCFIWEKYFSKKKYLKGRHKLKIGRDVTPSNK